MRSVIEDSADSERCRSFGEQEIRDYYKEGVSLWET